MSSQWTFFTNYGHVLFLVDKYPDATLREMSTKVGITERSIQRIVSDLVDDGYLKVSKVGRHNSYKVIGKKRLKHDVEKDCKVHDIIQAVNPK